MLRPVYAALSALQLPFEQSKLRHYINITRGESISLSLFYDGWRFYQIKASEFIEVQPEHEALKSAYLRHPRFVPQPLGYMKLEGWSILVSEGVLHTGFPAYQLPNLSSKNGPVHDLTCYFEQAAQQPAGDGSAALRALLDAAAIHFVGTPFAQRFQSCRAQALSAGIESLDPVPQHGDFVLNNLACRDNVLVIFDWEDFGKVHLPGFDLFTLYLSAHGNRAEAAQALIQQPMHVSSGWQHYLAETCRRITIDVRLFSQLIPLYLLLFLYLKRNYGVEVQRRIAEIVDTLLPYGES